GHERNSESLRCLGGRGGAQARRGGDGPEMHAVCWALSGASGVYPRPSRRLLSQLQMRSARSSVTFRRVASSHLGCPLTSYWHRTPCKTLALGTRASGMPIVSTPGYVRATCINC